MTEQRNLILAIVLSIVIVLGFQFLYEAPRRPAPPSVPPQTAQPALPAAPNAPAGAASETAGAAPPLDRAAVIADTSAPIDGAGGRVRIDTPRLHGSVWGTGARFDDLTLADYHLTTDPKSPEIVLLAPTGTADAYYAEFGWVAQDKAVSVPDDTTRWTGSAGPLTPSAPVTLRWDNGKGLSFERTVAIDENYMFTVTQRVRNAGSEAVTLFPYGLISRHGTPTTLGYSLLHEGPLGVLDGTLKEFKYKDLQPGKPVELASTGGWLGITDKYWLVSLIPDQKDKVAGRFLHTVQDGRDRYQVDYLGSAVQVPPGGQVESTNRLFAGAKEVHLLDNYEKSLGVPLFDHAIDFGWFYPLTRPFFYALDFLRGVTGNFGVAILIFTVFVKACFFPLANRSYRAMSKMKRLQPEIMKIRERFGEDRARMNQEVMSLYKREKVNPVSGCLPIFIQIPVFFSLYKVLLVTIEMRQAPFFGWIKDLSVPDPTSVFNLFGLLPFTPPHFLMIGAWPLVMGVTMFLQQKLNPAPADPMQQRVFMALPVVFTFMLAQFPAGLVIYWAWNNTLSILQQWLIMRQAGVRPK